MTDIRAAREAFYGKKTVSRGAPSGFEMREDGSGGLVFRGFASITDRSYPVWDWLGEYDETIARGAFGKSLQEQDDVRLLINHEGVPLARTKSRTLDLREIIDPLEDPQSRGQTGLWCEASLDASNPDVQKIRSAMTRGDLSEMSFTFMATRQEWNEDWSERTVNEVKLLDVSVVTYPANPATSASLSDERSAAKREQILALLRAGNRLDDEQQAFVKQAFDERDAMVTVNISISEVKSEESEAEEVDETLSADRAAIDMLAEARFESARLDAALH